MTHHNFDPSILREYDIRGVIGETLREADARAIGRTFGTLVAGKGGRRVAVGYDGRLSSPALEAALVEGLTQAGIDALSIGRGPTPMLYFAVHHLKADGGIMVTGSHNPPNHNGFKMMLGHKPFFGEDIKRLGRLAGEGQPASGAGRTASHDVRADYLAGLVAAYGATRGLKVAWDCGNGATGEIVSELVKRLPGQHDVLFAEIDGRFPAHHPDPTVPDNLRDLQRVVGAHRLDLGIAFDGDGDRIGVIDGRGRVLWGDQILVLLARDVLKAHPGATVIADVKASQVLFDEIAKAGGKPLMYRTGHSLIKNKMRETGAPLAGEMSGHIFFADRYYGFDDAIYAAVRLLDVLARGEQDLAGCRDRLPQIINTPEIRFDCADIRKFAVVAEVKERLAKAGARVNDIDGVRVSTADGWWLLRASNTQPVLVARCEASDAGGLERMKAAVREVLQAAGVALPKGF
ncbi:MAG: phosphomannomutase/phosphoglucomutase [Alphaproteobacteria bacterium]|nr:phosphomannomutase/phosphoglucomutase [Alphaproteobacteria bacterium]